ncbi:MAG: universal stress protein [Moorea sp. SIO3C2]|nr:universal stress protein [Moorena sp. SIO3C2]
MFNTVVFPIDSSRESREAAEVVGNIVQKYSSNLYLLSVVEKPDPDQATGAAPEAMTSPEAVTELLNGAKALFAQEGIEAKTVEREGKPAFVICDVADEIGANLIVMGSRGLGLTDEGIANSVADRVINLSPCPVLIIP